MSNATEKLERLHADMIAAALETPDLEAAITFRFFADRVRLIRTDLLQRDPCRVVSLRPALALIGRE